MTESARELAKPTRDTIALYLQQSFGFTLAAGIANAENIIAALSAAGFAIVPVEGLRRTMTKACGQAMACAFPEDYQGDKTEKQVADALQREHNVALEIAEKHVSALLTASKENT